MRSQSKKALKFQCHQKVPEFDLICVISIIFLRKFSCPILTSTMSGSAILQDGKIIGAVTHVLLDDPSRGYGIFIENMLSAAGLSSE